MSDGPDMVHCPECGEFVREDEHYVGWSSASHQCPHCEHAFEFLDGDAVEPIEEEDHSTLMTRLELFLAACDMKRAIVEGKGDDGDTVEKVEEWHQRAVSYHYAAKNREQWQEIAAFLDEAETEVSA